MFYFAINSVVKLTSKDWRALLGIYGFLLLAMDANDQNYYELLNVELNATSQEIAKAFRRKALIYHPDKVDAGNHDAAEKFISLSDAYECLMDADARAAYDQCIQKEINLKLRRARAEPVRNKYREDLEKREKAAESMEYAQGHAALRAEVDRLRRDGLETLLKAQIERQSAIEKASAHLCPVHTLKLRWKRKKYNYSDAQIREIFGRYGRIRQLKTFPELGKAYLLYFQPADAESASNTEHDDELLNFLISFVEKKGPRSPQLVGFLNEIPPLTDDSAVDRDSVSNFADQWVSPHSNLEFQPYRRLVLDLLANRCQKDSS